MILFLFIGYNCLVLIDLCFIFASLILTCILKISYINHCYFLLLDETNTWFGFTGMKIIYQISCGLKYYISSGILLSGFVIKLHL